MSHTPEPWALSDSPYGAIFSNATPEIRKNWCLSTRDTGRAYGYEVAVANARRIVDCVNACAGKETEDLEAMEGKDIFTGNLFSKRVAMEKERDTYRELCAELVGIIKEHINYVDDAIHCDFKNAIAKAEAILGDKNGTSND